MRTLKVRETKNGEDRVIGLSSKVRAILESIIKERGLTDPDDRFFPVTPNEITWAFRRCCRVTEMNGQYVEPIGDRLDPNRSEERRVGKEWGSTGRLRGTPYI